jgi:hypothetical protein
MPPDFSDKPSAIRNYNLASPCPMASEPMTGPERFRICRECEHYIYEFSGLSLHDSKQIVFKREGKATPTFYRREDGTFTTVDCPKSPAKQLQKWLTLGVDAAVGFMVLSLVIFAVTNKPDSNADPSTGPEIAGLAKAKGKLGVGSINSFGVVQRHRPHTIRPVINPSVLSPAHAIVMPGRSEPGTLGADGSGIGVSNTNSNANGYLAPASVPSSAVGGPPRVPQWSGYFGQSHSSAQPGSETSRGSAASGQSGASVGTGNAATPARNSNSVQTNVRSY